MIDFHEQRKTLFTFYLMQNDCETLKAIALQINNPIFGPAITPYMALFCRSTQECLGTSFLPPELDAEIYDIRNSIKNNADRYGKSKKRLLQNDELQDNEYREQLRFNFMKKLNAYYNLGIFFDNDLHVIGNTQQFADLLSLNSLTDAERKEKTQRLSYNIGSVIGKISRYFSILSPAPIIQIENNLPSIYYCDQNTNRSKFFSPEYGKDVNLFLLNILCNIGFVKYLLELVVPITNPWVFRIKYIVTYYSLSGLNKLKSHLENNSPNKFASLLQEIKDITDEGNILFASKFRNCMMHYDLVSDDVFAISDACFDEGKIYYGLVEDCFFGKTYEQFYAEISAFSNKIEELLTKQFDFQTLNLRKL